MEHVAIMKKSWGPTQKILPGQKKNEYYCLITPKFGDNKNR